MLCDAALVYLAFAHSSASKQLYTTFEAILLLCPEMSQSGAIKQSEVDLASDAPQKPSKWRSWRVTVLLGALVSSAVLLFNICVLIWVTKTFEVVDGVATVSQVRLSTDAARSARKTSSNRPLQATARRPRESARLAILQSIFLEHYF